MFLAINFYLILYPFLRFFIYLLIVGIMQFFFIQNIVHAESITPAEDSTTNVTSTYKTVLKIGFGIVVVTVCILGFYLYVSSDSGVDATEDALLFTPEVSVPVQDYALDLLNVTVSAALTKKGFDNYTLPALHSFCFSQMLDYFNLSSLTGKHSDVISSIKFLTLRRNLEVRFGTPDHPTIFTQVLKAYVQIFSQSADRMERTLCKAISVNHILLGNPKIISNHEAIITQLAGNGFLQGLRNKFDLSITQFVNDLVKANSNSTSSVEAPTSTLSVAAPTTPTADSSIPPTESTPVTTMSASVSAQGL
jgi:hypothetical protein